MIKLTAEDAELFHAIRTALDRAPQIDSFDVRVDVEAGRVELTGSVGSHSERLAVRDLAAVFARSEGIVDGLRVRATFDGVRVSDEELLASGRAALTVGSIDVELSVTQHVATLTGQVASEGERRRARHLIESIPGVDFVDNQVTVG